MFSSARGILSRMPRTGRSLIIAVFDMAIIADGAIAIYELLMRGRTDIAASAIGAAYGTTILFGVVYGVYCLVAPGETSRDSTNSRVPPTGRSTIRNTGLFCAALLLVRAISSFNDINLVQTALPLFGVFATVTALGLLSRLYASVVTLDQDQGIKTK